MTSGSVHPTGHALTRMGPIPGNPTTPRKLLRPIEVAERLGLSREAVYVAIRRGDIPAIRLTRSRHGSLRIPEDELNAVLYAPESGGTEQ